jgi:hypothetical protein
MKRMIRKTKVLRLENGLGYFPILQLPCMSRTSATDLVEALESTYYQCAFNTAFT